MANAALKLEERLAVGGGKVKRLRKKGYIPAVVYGGDVEPRPVQVKVSDFREFISKNGRNTIFNTQFGDEAGISALVKEIKYDTQNNSYIHIDFQRVSMNEKIRVDVPIRVVGREMIERGGGVLAQQIDEITVECLPADVLKQIEVDIAHMAVGDSLTVGELDIPSGVVLLSGPEDIILSITAGKASIEVEKVDEDAAPEDTEKVQENE